MKPSIAQYAKALFSLSRESGGDVPATAKRCFDEVRRRGDLKKLPEIIERAERMEEEMRGETRVRVLTREPLSRQGLELVGHEAERLFGASEVRLEPELQESILGGIILETDTSRIDASVKRKLQQLKQAFRT